MKLSKQEQIGILIIAVVIIIVAGVFLFIMPKINEVGETTKTLENKQTQLSAALEKQETKEDLKKAVIEAYEEGQGLADMFFDEMTAYEADMEFRAFLDQCEAKVVVNDLQVGEPSVTTLAPQFFEETEVVYALKTYVTQNIQPTDEEIKAQERDAALRNALGSSQDVGSITVSFTVTSLDQDELIKFCDEVNEYMKVENGTKLRKAMMLNGFALSYPTVEKDYTKQTEEITPEIEAAATKALYDNLKKTMPPAENTPKEPAEEEEEDISDWIYSVETSVTFFSVVGMEDPTAQLQAQDDTAA